MFILLIASAALRAEDPPPPGSAEPSPIPSATPVPPPLPALPRADLGVEASPFFFEGGLVPGDLSLIITGSYSAEITMGAFFSGNAAEEAIGAVPPAFKQTMDLTLELPLGKGWSLKARIADDSTQNRYSLVYKRRDPHELVSELSVGNADFPFDSSGELDVGASGPMSPGIGLRLGDDPGSPLRGFNARALIRYEASETTKKTYLGYNEVAEAIVPAASYIRGRFFLLPNRPISQAWVYVRSASGALVAATDGYSYVSASGAAISLSRGAVDFDEPLPERSLVAYDPPPASLIQIEGRNAVAVYEPGADNQLEVMSRYEIPIGVTIGTSVEAGLYHREGSRIPSFALNVDAERGYAELYALAEEDPYAIQARRPLLALEPSIYGAGAPPGLLSGYEIRFSSLVPATEFTVPLDIVQGTLVVKRNGADDGRWSHDPATGVVTFLDKILPTDRIVLEYAARKDGWGAGDLVAAAFADFTLRPGLSAFAGFSLRQSLAFLSSGAESLPSPGQADLVAGLKGERPGLKGSIDLRLAYRNPDADGKLGVDSIGDAAIETEAAAGGWKRAALPPARAEADRAPLYYRDYSSADLWGNVSLAPLAIGPGEPGRRDPALSQGPYPVSDSSYESAAVAEFELGVPQWTGMQLSLGQAYADASYGVSAIVVPLRFVDEGGGGSPAVTVEVGAVASGPDDDGTDLEYPSMIASVAAPALGSSWTEVSVPLGSTPSLYLGSKARVRIVIASAGNVAGRVLVGTVRAAGSPWELSAPLSPPSVSSIDDELQGPSASFGSDFTGDSGHRFLRASFPNLPVGRDALFKRSFEAIDMGQYGKFSLYLRRSASWNQASGSRLVVSLRSGGSEVRRYEIDPALLGPGWTRLSMRSDSGASARLEDASGSGADLGAAYSSGALGLVTAAAVETEGVIEGDIDIAGFFLSESVAKVSLSSTGTLSWERKEALLSAGSLPVIHNVRLSLAEELALGSYFSAGLDANGGFGLFPFLDMRGSIGLRALADSSDSSIEAARASHGAGFLLGPGSLSADYFQDETGAASLSAAGGLDFKEPFALTAGASALRSQASLSRAWNALARTSFLSETLSVGAAFQSNETDGEAFLMEEYFRRWLESFSELVPLPGAEASFRSIGFQANLDGKRKDGSASKDASLSFSASQQGGPAPRASGGADLSIAPAIPLGPAGTWRILPLYERSMRLSVPGEGSWFDAEFASLERALGSLPAFYAGIPIAEFWDDEFTGELLALPEEPFEASLSAKIGAGMSRERLLGLRDLLIPSACRYSFKRKALREGATLSDVYSHEIGLTFAATDALGNRGSARLLKFIDSDNIFFDHLLSLSDEGGVVKDYLYAATVDLYLAKNELDTIRVLNILSLSSGEKPVSESVTLKITWGKAASERLERARSRFYERQREKPREKRIDTFIPSLAALETEPLKSLNEIMAGFTYGYAENGLESYAIPLSYDFGFMAGAFLKATARVGTDLSFTRRGDDSSYDVRPALGLKLELMF